MMKYIFIPLFCLVGISSGFGQSDIKEAYFHELRGMEDSSEVTHLFYRMYKKSEYFCDEGGYERYLDSQNNHLYHFNASMRSDSIFFRDSYSEWCIEGGMSEGSHVNSYIFLNNDLNKWIIGETSVTTDPAGGLMSYNSLEGGNYFSTGFFGPQKILQAGTSDTILVGINSDLNRTLRLSSNSENWPDYFFPGEEMPDSLTVDKNVLAVSPYSDSVYFATTIPYLYKSTNYGKSYTLIDTVYSWDFDDQLLFSNDSTHIYSMAPSGVALSDNFGNPDSWKLQKIQYSHKGKKFLSIDPSTSGNLFVSDSTSILFSENHGNSFSELFSVEHQITGLYKKPNSNLLYVLTRKELLEVNTETKETTSLKKIPVSNEPEPSEIPNQITLEQNYPNPFNPTTVISYQLALNSLVRLEVFDVTGRKVAVLVNGERKAAGTHRVTFNAENLASGVYFYRLETGGKTLTQKMVLVK